jgi:Host cell surface-exposed lipoprotein
MSIPQNPADGQQPPWQPVQSPPRKRWARRHPIWTTVFGVIALIVIISATGHGSGNKSPSSASSAPAAVPAAATPSALATQQYTVSQHSAIQDAESYLQTEPGFSKLGLIGQLEYDKFPRADARFAVNHITVNWDQQAAADAKNYMQTEGGFSYGGLVQQLEYDKFTPAQAAHGARSVGL